MRVVGLLGSVRGSWLLRACYEEGVVATLLRLSVWLLASEWLAYGHWLPVDENQRNTLFYLAIIFLLKSFLLHRLEAFPGGRSAAYRLALVLMLFAFVFFMILALRLGYGRGVLFVGMCVMLLSELVLSVLREQLEVRRYVLVPPVELGATVLRGIELARPDNPEAVPPGVLVVEPEAAISYAWLQFIARASASGRRVISRQQLQEKMTGKVVMRDLTAVELDTFMPVWLLLVAKRTIDVLLVLLVLPVVLPLGLVVALLVRLDSPGNVIFRQLRIGRGNQPFFMLKFRSMHGPQQEARFVNQESERITRFGYFIRATHLDELPQLLNVLKGDMSLVGPRPEQPQFVEVFERELPFYSYRHLVRPGITGWAQVCQGYAADTDATREKLSYDFFYIKNLSLWLDVLILVRTIRSVLFDRHPRGE